MGEASNDSIYGARKDALLGELRSLLDGCAVGGAAGPRHFRDLLQFLLGLTVMKRGEVLDLDDSETFVIGGSQAASRPVQLNDGRYLLVRITGSLAPRGSIRVRKASFQYQLTDEPWPIDDWILRYDNAGPGKPSQFHLHVNARLPGSLAGGKPLVGIHLPTGRVSLEQVIETLHGGCGVRCNEDDRVWRPLLKESREWFELQVHYGGG